MIEKIKKHWLIQSPIVIVSIGLIMGSILNLRMIFWGISIMSIITIVLSIHKRNFSRKYIHTIFYLAYIIGYFVGSYSDFERNTIKDLRFDCEISEIEGKVIDVSVKGMYISSILVNVDIVRDSSGKNVIGGLRLNMLTYPKNIMNIVENSDTVLFSGIVVPVESLKNRGYAKYLLNKKIYFYSNIDSIVITNKSNNPINYINRFKSAITRRIDTLLPNPNSQLIYGIVYGQSSSFDEDLDTDLRRTGTSHIVAVSGYNVSILLSAIGILCSILGRRNLYIFQCVFVVLFMIFVGLNNIPVVRAGLMGLVYTISLMSGRKKNFYSIFLFLGAVLFISDPEIYKNISFQLSFAATFGIVYFSRKVEAVFCFLPGIVRENLSTTLAAILFTLPVTLLNFHEMSIVAIIINLLVLPVVSYITLVGLLLVVSIFILPALSKLIASVLWFLSEYVIRVVQAGSGFNFASIAEINAIGTYFIIMLIAIIFVFITKKYEKVSRISSKI